MESQQAASTGSAPSTWCAELELAGGSAVTGVRPYTGQSRARVLLRLHGDPVGYVDVVGVQPLVRPDNLIRPPCSGSVDQSCEFPTRSSAVTARADHEQAS